MNTSSWYTQYETRWFNTRDSKEGIHLHLSWHLHVLSVFSRETQLELAHMLHFSCTAKQTLKNKTKRKFFCITVDRVSLEKHSKKSWWKAEGRKKARPMKRSQRCHLTSLHSNFWSRDSTHTRDWPERLLSKFQRYVDWQKCCKCSETGSRVERLALVV